MIGVVPVRGMLLETAGRTPRAIRLTENTRRDRRVKFRHSGTAVEHRD